LTDRLPPLPLDQLDADQRAAADELIAGPRKAVKGPFIPLLRSPALLQRVGRLGEYLRFDSVLPARWRASANAAWWSSPRWWVTS
jgi:4-carboxymuconolactone decarboxylase